MKMKYGFYRIVMLFLILININSIKSQNNFESSFNNRRLININKNVVERNDTLICHFSYPKGTYLIRKDYLKNNLIFNELENFLNGLFHNPQLMVNKLQLYSYSSIDGSYYDNKVLAERRAENLSNFITKRYFYNKKIPTEIIAIGEDWHGLRNQLMKSNINDKNKIIKIIDNVGIFDGREKQMMKINMGKTYREISTQIFPSLIRIELIVKSHILANINDSVKIADYIVNEPVCKMVFPKMIDSIDYKTIEPFSKINKDAVAKKRVRRNNKSKNYKPLFAIKTNLSPWAGIYGWPTPKFDKIFIPNGSLEIFFAHHLSLEGAVKYSNWDTYDEKKFVGISCYRAEPRFWFLGKNKYKYFALGIFGQSGDYNFRNVKSLENDSQKTNYTGKYWGTGLSLGFYLPLSRHLGIEFGAHGGFFSSNVKEYTYKDIKEFTGYEKKKTGIGLSEVNLNISYRFNKRIK